MIRDRDIVENVGQNMSTWGTEFYPNLDLMHFRKQVILMADAAFTLTRTGVESNENFLRSNMLLVDAGSSGASENLLFPPVASCPQMTIWVWNVGGETVNIQDSAGALIHGLAAGAGVIISCDGTTWRVLAGAIPQLAASMSGIGSSFTAYVAAVALTGDIDLVMPFAVRVVDVVCHASAAGGAADTIQVKNGANAISDAIDLNIADTTVARPTTMDDAQSAIAAGGTLRVTGASAVNARVYIHLMQAGAF